MNENIKAFLADKYENLFQIERDLVNGEFDYWELIQKLQNLPQLKQQGKTFYCSITTPKCHNCCSVHGFLYLVILRKT